MVEQEVSRDKVRPIVKRIDLIRDNPACSPRGGGNVLADAGNDILRDHHEYKKTGKAQPYSLEGLVDARPDFVQSKDDNNIDDQRTQEPEMPQPFPRYPIVRRHQEGEVVPSLSVRASQKRVKRQSAEDHGNCQPLQASANELLGGIPGRHHRGEKADDDEKTFHPKAVDKVMNDREDAALPFQEPRGMQNYSQAEQHSSG